MSKKDRVLFMNDLAKDDPETKVPIIINEHYSKFNYGYEILDYIESLEGFDKIIGQVDLIEHDSTSMEILVSIKKKTKVKDVVKHIESFIQEHNGDTFATIKTIKSDKINISIKTSYIEEDKYDDN